MAQPLYIQKALTFVGATRAGLLGQKRAQHGGPPPPEWVTVLLADLLEEADKATKERVTAELTEVLRSVCEQVIRVWDNFRGKFPVDLKPLSPAQVVLQLAPGKLRLVALDKEALDALVGITKASIERAERNGAAGLALTNARRALFALQEALEVDE